MVTSNRMRRAGGWIVGAALVAMTAACNPEEDGPSQVPTPFGPDTTPPTFAGVKHASPTSDTEVQLTWDPATDDQAQPSQIVYLVWYADSYDKIDFAKNPAVTTPGGSTATVVSGLKAAHAYSFSVHAIDLTGNADTNTAHADVTTPDTAPPTFGGVTSVSGASTTSLLVSWDPAVDNGSDATQIRYSVFVTNVAGKEDYAAPAKVTPYGATSATVDGLAEATTYYVVVRAIDSAGNVSPNTKELSSMTLDATPPTFGGIVSATATGTTIGMTWSAASDNIDAASKISYDIYQATAPGAEDLTKPTFVVTGVTTFSSNAFDPSTRYCFVIRAKDSSGNEESNTVEQCAITAASADTTPPVFGGLAAAAAGGSTSINLTWGPAADDYTPPASIVYDIYQASSAGGETFSTPTKTVTGATTTSITGLTANTTYFFVVRAKDAAGNEDGNTTEKSAKTLP
jgi:hypothetical protein